jgi:sugar ABC transporter, ATP binding protein
VQVTKLLELKNISKTFPGVKALQNVNLDLKAGEVLGLWRERRGKIDADEDPHRHRRPRG